VWEVDRRKERDLKGALVVVVVLLLRAGLSQTDLMTPHRRVELDSRLELGNVLRVLRVGENR
jgi:hypothetical protein